MKVKLFTTPDCVFCPTVKRLLDRDNIPYESIDASTPEGREALFKTGVRAVPYLEAENDYGSEHKAVGSAISVASLKKFLGIDQ